MIQNSKKKGPEYGKEFELILTKAFKHISEACGNPNIFKSLNRLLNIWEERLVYDVERIQIYRDHLKAFNTIPEKIENEDKRKRKSETMNDGAVSTEKKPKSVLSAGQPTAPAPVKISEIINGNDVGTAGNNSNAYIPTGEPPEPEELVKAVLELENSASSDAVVRSKIANLPPEVSEITLLSKLEDKEQAAKLATQVNEAVVLLSDYNSRLATEMEHRKKLTVMLKEFLHEQKELLAQAEHRLKEYNTKLGKIKNVQREVRDHLQNLPDLKQLPDVTGGLAPLPSAGDLFNIH